MQEVNFPRTVSRYKDLISVEVSDESFQRLIFKPRKVRRPLENRDTKEGSQVKGRVTPKEPMLMDLYPHLISVKIFSSLSPPFFSISTHFPSLLSEHGC